MHRIFHWILFGESPEKTRDRKAQQQVIIDMTRIAKEADAETTLDNTQRKRDDQTRKE